MTRRLPEIAYQRVLAAIALLVEEPKPSGARKMRGTGGAEDWRIRVGDYRIVYRIEVPHPETVTEDLENETFAKELSEGRVTLLAVGHRGSVYG